MAKRRVTAIVKIQLPAGQGHPRAACRHGARSSRCADDGVRQAVQRRDRGPGGQVIPVEITIFEDRSFTFVLKTPPTPVLLRQAAGVDKGSPATGRETVGYDHRHPARRDRPDQDAGPQRQRHRGGQGPGGRHGPVDGHQSRLTAAGAQEQQPTRQGRTSPRPSNTRETACRQRKEIRRRHEALRPDAAYAPGEAVDLVRSLATASFDETVEMAVRLGIDPRKADQVVRGTVPFRPAPASRYAWRSSPPGAAAEEARAAGADVVGADDLVARVDGGFMDFDVAIATPDLMGQVGRLGRKLGPGGLMPNPKTGTVTTDVGRAVTEFKGGRVEYRADTRSRRRGAGPDRQGQLQPSRSCSPTSGR